jgi:lipopolysaccharide cholinephosphotransferase
LAFGTFLGAVRERDFIEHDKDTDVMLLDDEWQHIAAIDAGMRECGFTTTRNWNGLISWDRGGEYIDCYHFTKHESGLYYQCEIIDNNSVCTGKFKLPGAEFHGSEIAFHGEVFRTPDAIPYLTRIYGSNWNIPIKGKHARHFE